jgi:hypothetical protein
VTKLLKLETNQNKIPPIKMAWKKITGVKWGQARRANFGHSEYPLEKIQKPGKLFFTRKDKYRNTKNFTEKLSTRFYLIFFIFLIYQIDKNSNNLLLGQISLLECQSVFSVQTNCTF